MKINFANNSSIEMVKTDSGLVSIILSTRDKNDSRKMTVTSAEVTEEQFKQLISGILS